MYRTIFLLLSILFLLIQGWRDTTKRHETGFDLTEFNRLRADCRNISVALSGEDRVRYKTCNYYHQFKARDRFFIQCYLAPTILVDDSTAHTVVYYCPPEKEQPPKTGVDSKIVEYPSGMMYYQASPH